jgi:hypothetical protein
MSLHFPDPVRSIGVAGHGANSVTLLAFS